MSEQRDPGTGRGAAYESAGSHPAILEAGDVEIVREREGLPRDFRMRADRHYVDGLSAPSQARPVRMVPLAQIERGTAGPLGDLRPLIESIRAHGIVHPVMVRRQNSRFELVSGRKRLVAAEQLRLAAVPCIVYEGPDVDPASLHAADNLTVRPEAPGPVASRSLAAAHRLIAEHLATVAGCAALPAEGASGLEPAGRMLLKAHAWRAAQLLGALDLLGDLPFPPRRERALASVLEDVVNGFEAEASLNGVTIQAHAAAGLSSSGLDEGQVRVGLAGAVLAILPLAARGVRPVVVITAGSTEAGGVALEIAQHAAPVPQRLVRDFFEDDPATDRAGGYAAALGALAARALASNHGGTAAFEALEDGSRLTLTLARRS